MTDVAWYEPTAPVVFGPLACFANKHGCALTIRAGDTHGNPVYLVGVFHDTLRASCEVSIYGLRVSTNPHDWLGGLIAEMIYELTQPAMPVVFE
jgi:hypothetical protein